MDTWEVEKRVEMDLEATTLSEGAPASIAICEPADDNSDGAAASDDEEDEGNVPEDDAFLHSLLEAVRACPAYDVHAALLEECCQIAGVRWRARFWEDKQLWNRIRRGRRLAKELSEIAPVLARARDAAAALELPASGKRLVVLDLCSGFGYLAMFLSELLAPFAAKVEKIVLVDVRWAPHNVTAGPQHLNPRHLLIDGWPIRLTTSRANLKAPSDRRGLARTFLAHGHPAWLFGVHLCGTLSLRAVDFFNDAPSIISFALKPCCLPGIVHSERAEVFALGAHSFAATDVCANGRWRRNRWVGTSCMEECERKFITWADHLYRGVTAAEADLLEAGVAATAVPGGEGKGEGEGEGAGGERSVAAVVGGATKTHRTIRVQKSWWQNSFIFAARDALDETNATPRSLLAYDAYKQAAAAQAEAGGPPADAPPSLTSAERVAERAEMRARAAALRAAAKQEAKQERRKARREEAEGARE